MDLSETGWESMKWIQVALDRDQWRASVNTVMKFRLPYIVGEFLSS
jgi:hypothetical protein